MLLKHAALQFGIALALFTLWAASDAWYTVTGLAIATVLSMLLAILAGVAVATVIHEWCHLLGAKLGGANYKIPEKLGLFVYDYDFSSNTLSQFNAMSLAGQFGSWLSVAGLALLIPGDNPGRDMLVCAAVGAAVYAGIIELPPLKRAQISGDPLAELSRIDQSVLTRAGIGAVAAILLLLFIKI
ncbi:MAG: hypothetical protein AAGI24_13650 [Pseudomonadota bacterium]